MKQTFLLVASLFMILVAAHGQMENRFGYRSVNNSFSTGFSGIPFYASNFSIFNDGFYDIVRSINIFPDSINSKQIERARKMSYFNQANVGKPIYRYSYSVVTTKTTHYYDGSPSKTTTSLPMTFNKYYFQTQPNLKISIYDRIGHAYFSKVPAAYEKWKQIRFNQRFHFFSQQASGWGIIGVGLASLMQGRAARGYVWLPLIQLGIISFAYHRKVKKDDLNDLVETYNKGLGLINE